MRILDKTCHTLNITKLKSVLMLFGLQISAMTVFAQISQHVSDSLWCDKLNEIIKCASLDEITERVRKNVKDSEFIAPFRPDITLTPHHQDTISKDHNKVNYVGYFYSSATLDKTLEKEFEKCYEKFKSCLEPWELARLDNNDSTITVPQDYFFTNSEDETSIRIDIYHDRSYQIRVRIF